MSEHHHSHEQDHTDPPSDLVLRVQALESLLIEKGLVDPAAIDVLIDTYETNKQLTVQSATAYYLGASS